MALTTASPERTPNWFARAWDSDIGHSFRTSPVTMLAAFVVLVIALAALFAPWIAPTDPFDPPPSTSWTARPRR